MLHIWRRLCVPGALECLANKMVTLTQAKDGDVCEEPWQRSGLVELVLFWCNEPYGHMVQTQTAVWLYHVLSSAGPRHAGRSTWAHKQPCTPQTKQAALAQQQHQ